MSVTGCAPPPKKKKLLTPVMCQARGLAMTRKMWKFIKEVSDSVGGIRVDQAKTMCPVWRQ